MPVYWNAGPNKNKTHAWLPQQNGCCRCPALATSHPPLQSNQSTHARSVNTRDVSCDFTYYILILCFIFRCAVEEAFHSDIFLALTALNVSMSQQLIKKIKAIRSRHRDSWLVSMPTSQKKRLNSFGQFS